MWRLQIYFCANLYQQLIKKILTDLQLASISVLLDLAVYLLTNYSLMLFFVNLFSKVPVVLFSFVNWTYFYCFQSSVLSHPSLFVFNPWQELFFKKNVVLFIKLISNTTEFGFVFANDFLWTVELSTCITLSRFILPKVTIFVGKLAKQQI